MINIEEAYLYSIETLEKGNIKHTTHYFPSGAIMLDIWYKELFYVLQFEEKFVGISEVNDKNISFDTIPDEQFFDFDKFKNKFTSLF